MDNYKLSAMIKGAWVGQVNHAVIDQTTGNLFLIVGDENNAMKYLADARTEFPTHEIIRAQRLPGSFVFKRAVDIPDGGNVARLVQ
jgi:hypothetical protein